MSTIDTTNIIVGNSPTQSQNLKITGNNDGTFTIGRADGSQTIMTVDGSGLITQTQGKQLTLATAQATTSGTSIDFTGIPSWVKRITVMLNGVSTNSTSPVQLQIGSGSVTTSGYLSNLTSLANGASAAVTNLTSGFVIGDSGTVTASTLTGTFTLTVITGNAWVCNAWVAHTNAQRLYGAQGGITLGGALDRIRLTTVNGTDAFDAGSVNIMYEG